MVDQPRVIPCFTVGVLFVGSAISGILADSDQFGDSGGIQCSIVTQTLVGKSNRLCAMPILLPLNNADVSSHPSAWFRESLEIPELARPESCDPVRADLISWNPGTHGHILVNSVLLAPFADDVALSMTNAQEFLNELDKKLWTAADQFAQSAKLHSAIRKKMKAPGFELPNGDAK